MYSDRSGGSRMEELKPCPFCGGEADIHITDDGYYVVGCSTLGCYCNAYESDIPEFPIEEYAIQAWNRRAE